MDEEDFLLEFMPVDRDAGMDWQFLGAHRYAPGTGAEGIDFDDDLSATRPTEQQHLTIRRLKHVPNSGAFV